MSMTSGAPEREDGAPAVALDDDALFLRLKRWFADDWQHHLEWMEGDPDKDGNGGAKEDFDFVAGRQWDETALQTLHAQGRPASVFNRVAPMVDAVCGYEVSNRQEVRYIPREVGDVGVNELLTDAAAWFRDQCDAEDEESDAFRDAAISGRGWTETRIDYETNPDGDPDIGRVDPFEVFPNWESCKPNFDDRKRVWRVRKMSLDAAQALLPDAEENELHAGWAATGSDGSATTNPGDDYDTSDATKPDPECTLIECQWWDREPFMRFYDPGTGQIVEMEVDKFSTLLERMLAMPPEAMMAAGIAPPVNPVRQYRRVYRRAFIGTKVFPQPNMIDGDFTYKAITGKRDKTKNQFYGLVRAMKDPQRWTNKLFSQIMHILNSNAKGGIMAERGAFEDDRKAAESWAKADGITWTSAGALNGNRIREKPISQLPPGQAQMLQFSMESMPLVTGINQELLGLRETNQPGVLEYQRKQSGLTILATLFDSQRRYRKEQGRLMLKMIQQYLSDGRLVKIAGEDGARYVPLVRQAATGDYDVIVDDAPTAPNSKDKNWAIVQSMLPLLMPMLQADPKLAAKVLQTSPLPESISQAFIEVLTTPPPAPPPPSPEDMERAAIMKAGAVAMIDKDAASAEKSRADAQATQAKTMRENIKAMMEALPVQTDLPPAPVPSGPIPGLNMQIGSLTPQPDFVVRPTPGPAQLGGLPGLGEIMPDDGSPFPMPLPFQQ